MTRLTHPREPNSRKGRRWTKHFKETERLYDPKVLRRILGSKPEVDWLNEKPGKILETRIEHPEFSGTVKTLIFRAFGLARSKETQHDVGMEELRMFLWFALEDEMIREDNEKSAEAAYGWRVAAIANAESADPLVRNSRALLADETRRSIKRLPPRLEKIIEMRYLDEAEPEKTADFFGMAIHKLKYYERRALRRLRDYPDHARLRDYYEGERPPVKLKARSNYWRCPVLDDYVVSLEKRWEWPKISGLEKRELERKIGNLFRTLMGDDSLSMDRIVELTEEAGFPAIARRFAENWQNSGREEIGQMNSYLSQGWKAWLFTDICKAVENETGHQINLTR